MAGAGHRGPAYTRRELESDARRMLEYVHAPLHADALCMAGTDADARLMSVMLGRQDVLSVDRVTALLHAAQAQNEATMAGLQTAETRLREAIVEVLVTHGETVDEDDDVISLTERLAELVVQLQEQVAADEAPTTPALEEKATEELADLYAARACTQLLADAEDAMALASAQPLTALVRIAVLVEDAPQRGPRESSMLLRTINSLTQTRDALYARIKAERMDALRASLKEAAWPPPSYQNPEKTSADESPYHLFDHLAVERAWADLCECQFTAASIGLTPSPTCIQAPATVSGTEQLNTSPSDIIPGSDAYVPLFAVQVLMEPILLRFRYHFDGARSTNRLDKPEWFLSHILGLIQVNAPLFERAPDAWTPGGEVAELTRRRREAAHPDAPLRQRYVAVDAPAELLHALLFPARQKIQASLPRLVHERALLAHNIFQFITFDAELREVYAPACVSAIHLADEIVGHERWFQAWLDGEREFTEQRFDAVMQAPGAWNLVKADTMDEENDAWTSDESVDVDADTTTRCACTLMHMLMGVTERFKPLHSLPQRCAFVIKVQRPLLDMFYQRLVKHLDAFENMSTAFSRALPGEIASFSTGPGNELVHGERGVTRVSKALLSAEYVKAQLQEWSESTFFLSMSQDVANLENSSPLYRLMALKVSKDDMDSASLMSVLQRGLQRGASAAAHLRPLASQQERTGEMHEMQPSSGEAETPGIWDFYIQRFEHVATRSAHALERLTVTEVLELLKPYILRRWDHDDVADDEASGEDGAAAQQDIPSRELVPALSRLTLMLQHMVQVLPPHLLLPVYRHIAASLSHAVVERIIMPNARFAQQFTPAQSKRFNLDVEQGWLHVARELTSHPKVSARRNRGAPTGLGRNPETAWRILLDAKMQVE